MEIRLFAICFALLLLSVSAVRAENWARFRGPSGQSHSTETGLPVHWSDKENIAWKTRIPGQGWSSPIVYEDHVFVTSTTEEGKSCHVIAVDRRGGEVLWNKKVFEQEVRKTRPENLHATPTPVTDGELVYAVFSAGSIVALSFSGEIVWTSHTIQHYSEHGLAASPILYKNLLIMMYDGSDSAVRKVGFQVPWKKAVILAVDKKSGKERWRGKRGSSRLGHVTPIVVRFNGADQLISNTGDVIQGHDPSDGSRIWSVSSPGEGIAPSNAIGKGLVYTVSGSAGSRIRVARIDGKGDVTDTHIAWEQTKGVPNLASFLLIDPYVYTATARGIVTCFQADDGKVVWQGRIGGKHSSSPVFADGKIYFLTELESESIIIEPGDKLKIVARNKLGEVCKTSIAVSQGSLFIRTEHHLYRIGKGG